MTQRLPSYRKILRWELDNARADITALRAEIAAKDKLIHEMEATLNATEWAQLAVAAKDKEIARLREARLAGARAETRQPTEAMVCAGDEAIIAALNEHPQDPQMRQGTPAEKCWRAMVDAAPRRTSASEDEQARADAQKTPL